MFFALQRVAGTPPAAAARGALAAVAAAAWVLRALVAAGGATELQAAFLLLAAALLVKRTRRAASVAGWFFAVSALAVAPSVRALAASAAVAVAAAVLATGVARVTARLPRLPTVAVNVTLILTLVATARFTEPAFAPRFLGIAAFARRSLGSFDIVCAAEGARDTDARWLPAIAGLAVLPPPRPAHGGGEVESSANRRACAAQYDALAAGALREAPAR